jgi:poly(hydroxyalkanoate) depolymerase family esterase
VKKRQVPLFWTRGFSRGVAALTRLVRAPGTRLLRQALKLSGPRRQDPPGGGGGGAWTSGAATGAGGALRFSVYRPTGVKKGEQLPLMVMLHGCGQDASAFACSTRMNAIATRERFVVMYPEKGRLSNPQGCWNWFDTRTGRAQAEADLLMKAIDQVCLSYPVDPQRVALAGLSAGASMAALLVTRHPDRFKALVMHSGIAPGTATSTLSALGAMKGRGTTAPLDAAPQAMQEDWPALLVIQGDADTTVSPINAGAAAQIWAVAARAVAGPARQVRRGKRYPMSVTDFKQGGELVASLVLVSGLGHAWSGGAASQPYSDARGPDASSMAWTFAARQFRIGARETAPTRLPTLAAA